MENHHQQTQRNLPSILDALYCEEDHLENDSETEECFTDEQKDESFDINGSFDLFSWDDEELSCLLSKEQENDGFFSCLEKNPILRESRHEAIEWMMNIVEHYSFSALTAVLGVNYLDRFLFQFQSHSEKPWMTQLAAVACLSLAAKVEETRVPLLLDFQVADSKYLFEAKTIKRMEILVLSTLEWKMNPVTPLSFLDYITRRLGLKCHLSWKFLRRCECLLLTIISDCRFMCYKPSVMATAIMLHVIKNIEPCTLVEFQEQLIHVLGIKKEKVEDCCSLIQEVASTVDLYSSNKRKFASLPGSPKGVIDISFSSDSSNDSWAVEASSDDDYSQPEPLSKKRKAQEQQHLQDITG